MRVIGRVRVRRRVRGRARGEGAVLLGMWHRELGFCIGRRWLGGEYRDTPALVQCENRYPCIISWKAFLMSIIEVDIKIDPRSFSNPSQKHQTSCAKIHSSSMLV